MSTESDLPSTILAGERLVAACDSVLAYRRCLEVRSGIGEGYSSLHHLLTCCSDGNLEISRALIDLNVANPLDEWKYSKGFPKGSTPLSVAMEARQEKIIEFLKSCLTSEEAPQASSSPRSRSLSISTSIPVIDSPNHISSCHSSSSPSSSPNSVGLPSRSSGEISESSLITISHSTPPLFVPSCPLENCSPTHSPPIPSDQNPRSLPSTSESLFRSNTRPSNPSSHTNPLIGSCRASVSFSPRQHKDFIPSSPNTDSTKSQLSRSLAPSPDVDAPVAHSTPSKSSRTLLKKKKRVPSLAQFEYEFEPRLSQSAVSREGSSRQTQGSRFSLVFSSKEAEEKESEAEKKVQRLRSEDPVKKTSQKNLLGSLPNAGSQVVKAKKKHKSSKGDSHTWEKDNTDKLVSAALGSALYKIFLHFHTLFTSFALSHEERARLEDAFLVIQTALIDSLPEKVRDYAHVSIGGYLQEKMNEKADPAVVGEKLLYTLLKNRSRDRSRASGTVNASEHRRSCLPQLDEEIANQIDVTSELYKLTVTPLDANETDVSRSFEILSSFLQAESEDDVIAFFNNTKHLDDVISLKEPVMGLSLLHVACSMGKANIIQAMIAKGYHTAAVTKDGCLPIHFFVEFGLQKGPYTLIEDAEILEVVLIDLIKDVSVDFCLPTNPFFGVGGDTLLHTAVRSTSVNLVKSLMKRMDGEMMSRKNSVDETAMEVAVGLENEAISMEMVEMMMGKMKKKEAEAAGEKAMEMCLSLQKRSMYNMVVNLLQQRLAVFYSIPGGFDVSELEPNLPRRHCLLLRCARKETLLDICFSLSSDSEFISAVLTCRAFCFTTVELAGSALQRMGSERYFVGVCRFMVLWSTIAICDISESDFHPILSSILSKIEGYSKKENDTESRHVSECQEKLRKILNNGPVMEVKMQSVSFYREWKDGPSGLRDICRKVMDVKMSPVIASHLLEWSVQVFDNISVAELACHPLKTPSNTGVTTWLKMYNNMLNDVCAWAVVHILSHNDAENRAKAIEFFIGLCEELMKVHNYHMSLGVSMALRSPPIGRLKDSWALVDFSLAAKVEEFNSFFSHSKNFARYRQAISSCQSPCAAYLGVALRDIIYLHDNTPSLVGRNQNIVNFYKLRGIYLCGKKWFTTKQYDTQGLCSPKICSYLSTIHNCQDVINDDFLQLVSILHEPHQSKKLVSTLPEISEPGIAKLSLILVSNFEESLMNPVNATKALKIFNEALRHSVSSPKRSRQGIFKDNSRILNDSLLPKTSQKRITSLRKEDA